MVGLLLLAVVVSCGEVGSLLTVVVGVVVVEVLLESILELFAVVGSDGVGAG